MKRFWICWIEGTDGGLHFKHFSLEEAKAEAVRLATLNKGKQVYILELIASCYVPGVEWLDIKL